MSVFLSSGSPSAQRLEPALQLRDGRLVDRLLHEQARAGAADVALVEVDPVDDPLDRLVEGGVVEDDVRRLAAELERQLRAGAGELALDRLADLGRAGEGDLVDVVVLDERGAGAAVAGDDVDDARRQLRLAADVGEEERGQRRRLGRLQHDRVPGRERGRDLPRQHQEREVPGDDLAGDADRLRLPARGTRTRACRPSPRSRRSARRRAAGRRRGSRGSACRRRGSRARRARASAPGAMRAIRKRYFARSDAGSFDQPSVVRGARGLDGEVDVLLARLGDLGELLLARGRHRREPLGRARLDELAADEEAVALLELDDLARLRARARSPTRSGPEPARVALGDLAHQSIVK